MTKIEKKIESKTILLAEVCFWLTAQRHHLESSVKMHPSISAIEDVAANTSMVNKIPVAQENKNIQHP